MSNNLKMIQMITSDNHLINISISMALYSHTLHQMMNGIYLIFIYILYFILFYEYS